MTAVGIGVWRLASPVGEGGVAESTAMSTLMDTGRSLRADVRRVVAPAADRMSKLAADPAVIAALRDGDRGRQTDACNRAILSSTEIDAFAMYDRAGDIVAINTVYASGRPIPPERVRRIPGMDPAAHAAGQPCLHNYSKSPSLEFQTTCHITPALFDSAGLSVAYSVPVTDPRTGQAVGVVSARVRSDRIADLTAGRTFAGTGGRVEFVTDAGKYFSEEISSGRAAPPVEPAVLATLVAPLVNGGVDASVVRHGDDYVGLFRLTGFTTVNRGGIQIVVLAKQAWLAREARQSRRAQAAGVVGVGLLLGLVAVLVRTVGRVRTLQVRTAEAAQRLDLAMDAGGLGSWEADLTTDTVAIDDRLAGMLGLSAAEPRFASAAWSGRAHPDDAPALRAALADHVAGRTPAFVSEHRLRHADGSWRWTLAIGKVVARAADGTPLRIVGTSADVNDRKATEARLAEARRQESAGRLAASRAAGMAEVATGVLHNVGNVLNSVNVSADLIRDRLRPDRPANLSKAVALIDGHRDDLAAFLTADSKGRQLPAYLALLARTIGDEQVAVLGELASLTRGVDHIKRIVQAQQESARASTFREPVRPAALVEEALRFNLLSLERHRVTVVRDLADVPEVELDKHKTLQILVNLVGNAKDAIKAAAGDNADDNANAVGGDRAARVLTVRLAAGDVDGRPAVRFVVADTGCGIAAENLARIFNHGFTTRATGHGFGLHSAANAAREMGGRLTAASDGAGTGATFTLEIPVMTADVVPAAAPAAGVR